MNITRGFDRRIFFALLFLTAAGCLYGGLLRAQEISVPSQLDIELLEGGSGDIFESTGSQNTAAKDTTAIQNTHTASVGGIVHLSLDAFNVDVAGRDTSQEGNWDGVRGGTMPPGHGQNDDLTRMQWTRVTVPPNGTVAASRKFVLPEGVTEVWWSYDMQLGSTWTPVQSVKLPGIASVSNGNFTTTVGGVGGGWAGLCKSFSNRGYIGADGRIGYETYHLDSDNFGRENGVRRVYGNQTGTAKDKLVQAHVLSTHPCLNAWNNPPTDKPMQQFGATNASSVKITDRKWHSIVHRVKLNTLPDKISMNDLQNAPRDGEAQLWIDGVLAWSGSGLNFTNNPDYYRLSFFLMVYHGGSADTTGTDHDIFFANFRYTTNSSIAENL